MNWEATLSTLVGRGKTFGDKITVGSAFEYNFVKNGSGGNERREIDWFSVVVESRCCAVKGEN